MLSASISSLFLIVQCRILVFIQHLNPSRQTNYQMGKFRVIKRLVAQSREFFENNLMQNVELRKVSYS